MNISERIDEDVYYVDGMPLAYHAALDEAQALATARLRSRMAKGSRTLGRTLSSTDITACTVKVLRSDGTIAATVRP